MVKEDCIFCQIANGKVPTEMVYENEDVACFKDNAPQTKVHLLLVPKEHYKDILELSEDGLDEATKLLKALHTVVKQENLEEHGFRVINNCGKGAGQSVKHVHFHIMSDPDKLKSTLV